MPEAPAATDAGAAPEVPVTYLFSRACPSHEAGVALLRRAAARAGVALALEPREVRDDAEARALGFPGSPTYLIAGRDLAEAAADAAGRHDACRAYARPDGRIGPLPHEDDLVTALRRAAR